MEGPARGHKEPLSSPGEQRGCWAHIPAGQDSSFCRQTPPLSGPEAWEQPPSRADVPSRAVAQEAHTEPRLPSCGAEVQTPGLRVSGKHAGKSEQEGGTQRLETCSAWGLGDTFAQDSLEGPGLGGRQALGHDAFDANVNEGRGCWGLFV